MKVTKDIQKKIETQMALLAIGSIVSLVVILFSIPIIGKWLANVLRMFFN